MRFQLPTLLVGIAILAIIGTVVYTGKITDDVTIDVQINQNASGAIFVLDHQRVVTAYDPVNITMDFRNTGSVTYDSVIGILIQDANLSTVYQSFSGGQLSQNPMEERIFQPVFYPIVEGLYWVHANATFSGKTIERFSSFFVNPLYPPSTGGGGAGSDTGTGAGTTPPSSIPIGRADMKIVKDPEVTIAQGESWMVFVEVQNTGEIPIHDIRLLGSARFPFLVEPRVVSRLSSNHSVIFLVDIIIPPTLDVGDYQLDLSAAGVEATRTAQMTVHVREISIRDEVWRTILNYQYLIQQLETDIKHAKEEGKNTEEVTALLEKARAELKRSEQLFNLEEYFRAKDQLALTKMRIAEVVRHLALLETPSFELQAYLNWLLLLIPLIAAMFYLLLLKKKRRKKETAI